MIQRRELMDIMIITLDFGECCELNQAGGDCTDFVDCIKFQLTSRCRKRARASMSTLLIQKRAPTAKMECYETIARRKVRACAENCQRTLPSEFQMLVKIHRNLKTATLVVNLESNSNVIDRRRYITN